MKKIYIPTEEELHKIQSLGANTYKYLLIKVIEALTMEDVIYEEIDMLEFAYEYLSEFPEIISSICRMYPERIEYSEQASKDLELCRSMLERFPQQDQSIYYLDNLSYFDQSFESEKSISTDPEIINKVAKILAEKILRCPKYRFSYRGPNDILDAIFACEVPTSTIDQASVYSYTSIDPVYTLKLEDKIPTSKGKKDISFDLNRNMMIYGNRYGLKEGIGKEYIGKDILSKPDNRVKKLIRVLEEHKRNYL